jgi:hypothetical protein
MKPLCNNNNETVVIIDNRFSRCNIFLEMKITPPGSVVILFYK